MAPCKFGTTWVTFACSIFSSPKVCPTQRDLNYLFNILGVTSHPCELSCFDLEPLLRYWAWSKILSPTWRLHTAQQTSDLFSWAQPLLVNHPFKSRVWHYCSLHLSDQGPISSWYIFLVVACPHELLSIPCVCCSWGHPIMSQCRPHSNATCPIPSAHWQAISESLCSWHMSFCPFLPYPRRCNKFSIHAFPFMVHPAKSNQT